MNGLFDALEMAYRRRRALRERFDVARSFSALEESCVPSYAHRNPIAAAVAWQRLLTASRLWRSLAPAGPILDFGAGTGEILHFLGRDKPYHFVEADDALARALEEFLPGARRERLQSLAAETFGSVLALDSLEHNDDVAAIVDGLVPALAKDGVMIVSGPTENALYRMGRAVAGFHGHYHKTTIYGIERILEKRLARIAVRRIPFGLPLFRVSAWRR